MNHFLEKLHKQLSEMTETEKDAWILSQAKLLPECRQEDFYKCICGTKKVMDMPERDEIIQFCKKVRNEDRAVLYETHYVEFDDYGHFHDEWEHDFYDPENAMGFLSSVFQGCHDLILLEEFESACENLDEVLDLQFLIEDHPDTDDSCEDMWMDLDMAIHERLLEVNRDDLLRDYIEACRQAVKDRKKAAEKIVSALEMTLFQDCKPERWITIITDQKPLVNEINRKLAEDLGRCKKEFAEKSKRDQYYFGSYQDKELISHIETLIKFFSGQA